MVWLRLQRTGQHLETFQAELAAFDKPNPYLVAPHFDPDLKRYEYLFLQKKDLPEHWPILISEILAGLRVSLDNMLYAVAQKHGVASPLTEFYVVKPDKGTTPSSPNWQPWPGATPKCLAGLSPPVIEAVKACQPYHGLPFSHIGVLNTLHSADKHEAPHLALNVPGAIYLTVKPGIDAGNWSFTPIRGPIESGDVIGFFSNLAEGVTADDFNGNIRLVLAVQDHRARVTVAIGDFLAATLQVIAQTVLPSFEAVL